MSTTTHHLSAAPAPWKSLFLSHLSLLPSPEFVFTTLHRTSSPVSSSSPSTSHPPTPFVPRLRYCIFRGMWGELPENSHNDAPRNPPGVYESEMPTFTTDVRMHKVADIFTSGPGQASDPEQTQGSGGGGPVEAAFWIKEKGTQWRISGTAYVIAEDIEGEDGGQQSSGVRTVKSEIGARMQLVSKEGQEWSWATELTAHFGNVSPGMRGTWRNPPPGTPVAEGGKEGEKLGQKVTDLHDPIARSNFRVVIIKPDEVEQLDLSDPATARRWKYTFVVEDGKGSWRTEELWP